MTRREKNAWITAFAILVALCLGLSIAMPLDWVRAGFFVIGMAATAVMVKVGDEPEVKE